MKIAGLSDPQSTVETERSSPGAAPDLQAASDEISNPAAQVSSPTRLPLLVLTSTFPKGEGDSTPAFVLDLSKRLQSLFRVTVLTPAVRGPPNRDEIGGVQVRRFHYFWPRSLQLLADGAILENVRRRRWLLVLVPFLLLFELIATYRWVRANRPAAIHAHWFIPQGLVAVTVGGLLKVPVVTTSHGSDVYGLSGRFWTFIRKAVASRSAAVTVVSHDMAANLSGLTSRTGEPPKVMPMGVDTNFFHPAQRDEALRERLPTRGPSILFVGRLSEEKGVRYLLQAMPNVLRDFPDCRLIIVGDGPIKGQLEALGDELGIGGNVRFVGGVSREDLPRYYAAAAIIVGPSLSEGFGMVFAEAMAAGRPVVASSVGGVGDIVVPSRTGLLVEPASPQALAEAIVRLLDSPLEARRMGALARRWVRRKFDWRNVAASYATLLAKVAEPQQATLNTDSHHMQKASGE